MTTAPADTFRRSGQEAPPRATPALPGRLRDLLAGKKVVITGVTGFIGEQLLWKILTELPETRPSVLVRRKGSADARDRVASLLRKPIFADVVAAAGGIPALLDERIEVIEGDLPNVPALPADLDVLVHCAGDVSFDPPIDQAFTTNVLGTQALLEQMLAAVRGAEGTPTRVPHYVHISTAYTAGRRRGAIPEGPHEHSADYRTETRAGLRMREQVEAESRTPERLAALRKLSEREHRRAGYLATAADTERRRLEWVEAELVKAGAERARSLGWTDVYTFTKALGEAAVVEAGAEIRVSIVRPAIVESSWKHPYPGWIEGFKMAEPLILAYGRGELPDFPASPDSVIDVVPCDYVVNAIVAVCATTPEPGEPAYYHVSSGARNPLSFRGMYGHIRNYFLAHPLERTGKATGPLPEWQFPGAASVERLLTASERVYHLADAVVTRAPRSERTREFARNLDRRLRRLTFVRRYQSLYNEYSQSELHFVDDQTLALGQSLDPDNEDAFAFDTAAFDWKTYVEEGALPFGHRLGAQDGRAPQQARVAADHDEGPEQGHGRGAGDRRLRSGRHDHVDQRRGAVPAGPAPKLPPLARLAEVARGDPTAARLPAGRAAGPRQLHPRGLPAVQGPRSRRGLERRVDMHDGAGHPRRQAFSRRRCSGIGEHRGAGHTTILITGGGADLHPTAGRSSSTSSSPPSWVLTNRVGAPASS